MSDSDLSQMSVKELHALKARIDGAIRAAIRASRSTVSSVTPVATLPTIDLEQEAQAWKARKAVAGLS